MTQALSADNAGMLVHHLISTRVDYYNSVLYYVAVIVLICQFQSALTAATRLIFR